MGRLEAGPTEPEAQRVLEVLRRGGGPLSGAEAGVGDEREWDDSGRRVGGYSLRLVEKRWPERSARRR